MSYPRIVHSFDYNGARYRIVERIELGDSRVLERLGVDCMGVECWQRCSDASAVVILATELSRALAILRDSDRWRMLAPRE